MRKISNFILITIFCLTLILSSGCSQETTDKYEKQSVSIVLGNHANGMQVDYENVQLNDLLTNCFYTYGYLSIISVDGDPEVVYAKSQDISEAYKSASKNKLESDAQIKAANVISELSTIKANNPEVDLLESLRLAVRSLANSPEGSQKIIIVIDNGLSTAGYVNLIDGFANVSVEDLIIEQAIPDFTDIKIIWFQLGDVSFPQPDLTPSQTLYLQELWTSIIESGGGTVEFSLALPGNEINGDLPYVSVSNLSVFFDVDIKFIGDSSDYLEPKKAIIAIEKVAEYLINHPSSTVIIAGTTASGDVQFCEELSLNRANAVRDTLIELGVSREQVTTIGLSFYSKWYIDDRDENGKLIETNAKLNRKVLIIDYSSSDAMMINQCQ